MGLRRLIFNIMLKVSRAKLRRGLSIYGVRSDYNLFGRIIYFMSPIEKDVSMDWTKSEGVDVLRFVPPESSSRIILYIHGGAFVIGLKDLKQAYIPFAARLAKVSNSEVWIPDYRTSPENPYPIPGEDCMTVYKSLLDRGVNPQDICVMGDACGANLALAMVLSLRDQGIPLPGSVATISGWTDLSLTGNSLYTRSDRDPMFRVDPIQGFANHYLQGASPHDSLASPFYADYTGFPPMYMLVGGREMLHDDTSRIAEKADAVGVDVTLDDDDEMIHIYPVFFGIFKEGVAAIERLAAFVKEKAALPRVVSNNKKKKRVGG
jgi:epsilon-lactone hydrolase